MTFRRCSGYQTMWWAHLCMALLFDLVLPNRTTYGHMLYADTRGGGSAVHLPVAPRRDRPGRA